MITRYRVMCFGHETFDAECLTLQAARYLFTIRMENALHTDAFILGWQCDQWVLVDEAHRQSTGPGWTLGRVVVKHHL